MFCILLQTSKQFMKGGADGEKEPRILVLASSQISPPTGTLHVSTVAMKVDILAQKLLTCLLLEYATESVTII